MSAKFPANPPGSNTDTSHGRSLPANCGRKPGLVGESCLLEPHSSSAPSPPQLPAGPRLLAPTPPTRVSHSWLLLVFLPKAQRQGRNFCRSLFKRPGRKKTFCRTFTTQKNNNKKTLLLQKREKNPPETVGPTRASPRATLRTSPPRDQLRVSALASPPFWGFVKVHRVDFAVENGHTNPQQIAFLVGFWLCWATTEIIKINGLRKRWNSSRVNMSQNSGMWPEAR